jgi:MFS-type transporter involved in bile tolerance (Atg22 family)
MTVNATATNSAALPVTRREVWSWAMYDFANSGYTTVVITAIFNAFFVSVIAGGADWATLLWTTVAAISYVIVMIVGPVLGAWADRRAAKKRVLALATVGCVLTTLALAPVAAQGDAWLIAACVLFIASNVFYSLGENFTAAFLPELATSEHIAVSAQGLEPWLCWRTRHAGCVPVVGVVAAGGRCKGHRLHPMDAGDYGRRLCAGQYSDFPVPARACLAARQRC